MSKKIILLIKVFGDEGHADAFIRTGEMHCKSIEEFKRIEGDVARGDQFEAPSSWYQPDGITLKLSFEKPEGGEKSFLIEDLAGPLIVQNSGHDRLNVYCMYAVTMPHFEESYKAEDERLRAIEKINSMLKSHARLSDEMLSFGEHAVIIFKVADFIEKVRKATISEGYLYWQGLVDYFDPKTFNGSFGEVESIFKKRNIYAYQKEFRFVFNSRKPKGTKTLHVGSLDGIAFKLKTREINSKLELKLGDDLGVSEITPD